MNTTRASPEVNAIPVVHGRPWCFDAEVVRGKQARDHKGAWCALSRPRRAAVNVAPSEQVHRLGSCSRGDLIGIQQLGPESIRPSLSLACAVGKEQGSFVL